jgi:ferredoxin
MFSLRLTGRECISCGICMDVCAPKAISMRTKWPRTPEGSRLTYLHLQSDRNREVVTMAMGTFPYLALPALCDGCARCTAECPTQALELRREPSN